MNLFLGNRKCCRSLLELIFHFDFNLDRTRNLEFHNWVKNSVFGWDVDDSAVDAHFISVECCSAVAAGGFSRRDF